MLNVEKVSDKFYVFSNRAHDYIEPPAAAPVTITGFEDFDFFVNPMLRWDGTFNDSEYVVSEGITGCRIPYCEANDAAEAIDKARVILHDRKTPQQLLFNIQQGIEQIGVSPRYRRMAEVMP